MIDRLFSKKYILSSLKIPLNKPTTRTLVFCTLYGALLSGCASKTEILDAKPVLAEAKMPAKWQNNPYNKKLVDDVNLQHAWGLKLPLELQKMLRQAQLQNGSILVAQFRTQVAQLDSEIAQGTSLPDVKASLSQREYQTANNDGKTHNQLRSLGFSAKWELDLWRSLADAEKQKHILLEAAQYQYEAAVYSAQSQVLLTWLDIIEQNNLIKLNQQNINNQKRRLAMSLTRLDNGLASSVGVRNVKTSLLKLQESQRNLYYKRDQASRRLNLLLGEYPSKRAITSKMLPKLDEMVATASPQDIVLNRPDIKEAEAKVIASGYSWNIAKKKTLPKLTLNATFDAKRKDASELFDINYWLGSITAALVQPIFYRDVLLNEAEKSRLTQQIQLTQFQSKLLTAWQEVEDALQNEIMLKQRQSLIYRALVEAKAAESQTENQYSSGLANSFELLAAQRTRTALETDRIKVSVARVRNRIKLALSLGLPSNPPLTEKSS